MRSRTFTSSRIRAGSWCRIKLGDTKVLGDVQATVPANAFFSSNEGLVLWRNELQKIYRRGESISRADANRMGVRLNAPPHVRVGKLRTFPANDGPTCRTHHDRRRPSKQDMNLMKSKCLINSQKTSKNIASDDIAVTLQ